MAGTHNASKAINEVAKKRPSSTSLVNNWSTEHSCFVQISHRRGLAAEEIATQVLTVFPDLFPGGKSPDERKRAVEGRVAIWISKWADDTVDMTHVNTT